jgi:hypothetical protein
MMTACASFPFFDNHKCRAAICTVVLSVRSAFHAVLAALLHLVDESKQAHGFGKALANTAAIAELFALPPFFILLACSATTTTTQRSTSCKHWHSTC